MLIPKYFLDQFVFIWGCEQCSKTFGDSWWWIQQGTLESKVEQSFSWIIQGTNVVKEQCAMVGPCISFVATPYWIAISQDDSNAL
jgi:hypothetical protein